MSNLLAKPPEHGALKAAMTSAMEAREAQNVQVAMLAAKRFPRDEKAALDRILNACSRESLASVAIYQYSRGGADIQGPSIRLAEAIAQNWGNLESGWREIERYADASGVGVSVVEAFAWDLESNYRVPRVFSVRHWRDTKKGGYALSDERDIYELSANQASRRVRACLLSVIPGDIVEDAQKQCDATLAAKADNSPEAQKKIIEAFAAHSVTKAQVEARIQRRIDAITPAQVVNLRKIIASLRDGMSKPEDWFESAVKGAAEAAVESGPIDPFKSAKAAEPATVQPDDSEERERLFIDIRETMHAATITLPRFEALAKEQGHMKADETMSGGKLPIERMREIHAIRGTIAGINQRGSDTLI